MGPFPNSLSTEDSPKIGFFTKGKVVMSYNTGTFRLCFPCWASEKENIRNMKTRTEEKGKKIVRAAPAPTVTLHVRWTPETKDSVDKDVLMKMPR